MTPESQPPDPGPPPLLNRVPPPLPENLNEVQRLIGVFVSPSKAFADIARRPRWWIPVLLMGILSTIYINAFTQRVGWERMIRQQIEQSSRSDNMTAQQREQAITLGAVAAKAVGYGAIVLTLVSIFITAAILMFMVNTLMGGDIKFGSMMGIVSYGFLPTLLVAALSMVVMYLKPPDDFDIRNPLMFNAGAFVPADSAQWIKVLGGSFDLFSFWIMALIAIGISAAAPKIPFGKALTAVIFPWVLYVAIRTAATAAFG